MKRVIEYTAIAVVCTAALIGSAWYLVAPTRSAEPPPAAESTDKAEAHHDGVKLTDAQVASADIELLAAGPRQLRDVLRLDGLLQPNQETLVKVTSRFPGVIRSIRKRLGDRVTKDEVLATVESNQSLTNFDLKAPMDGTVVDRDGVLGEFAPEQRPLFTIADLSTLWADFSVHQKDFGKVRLGDAVAIDVGDGNDPISARIDYISPIGVSDTQSAVARAVVPNSGRLRAGMFISGRATLSARAAAVAVSGAAIQSLEGKSVVFVREGENFIARQVELGQRDADWVEVKSGLAPGEAYAARNSFVVKAEFGKSGAAHDH